MVLAARREAELETAKRGIAAKGGRAAALVIDLADRAELRTMAAEAGRPFGPPDILVNAAGINIRKPMPEVTEADWDAVLRINLDAPFFLAQALAPRCRPRLVPHLNLARCSSGASIPDGRPYALQGIHPQAHSRPGRLLEDCVTANAIAPCF